MYFHYAEVLHKCQPLWIWVHPAREIQLASPFLFYYSFFSLTGFFYQYFLTNFSPNFFIFPIFFLASCSHHAFFRLPVFAVQGDSYQRMIGSWRLRSLVGYSLSSSAWISYKQKVGVPHIGWSWLVNALVLLEGCDQRQSGHNLWRPVYFFCSPGATLLEIP